MSSVRGKSGVLRACFIWGFATLFYFYDNLLQVSPSAMKPELSLAFVRDAEQFGSLSAYCLYAYGFMQIPAGILMDRFGPRRLLTLACLFCSVGSLLFGLAEGLWEAKSARAMIGVGAAFALVGCLRLARNWFSSKSFALITGLTVTVGFLGAAFSLSMVNKIVECVGWRESMRLGGLIGLVLSLVLWLVIRDKRGSEKNSEKNNALSHSNTAAVENLSDMWQGLMQVLRHQQTWIAALYAGLMFVPTLAFGGLWGIPFLVEAHGFDRATAGMCISLIYVGWVVGSPSWGLLSDYLKRRNLPMKIATIMTLGNCILLLYCHPLPLPVLSILLFCLGLFSSGFILAFTVVQESNPARIAGTAIGFTNALNTLWGALAQPMIGCILDLNSPVLDLETGEKIFSLAHYQHALLTLPIALALSFCLLLFLKETHCQTKD